MDVKIIQINTARRTTACHLLAEKMIKENIDIALVQEPSYQNNDVKGFPMSFKRIFSSRSNLERIKACVIVNSNFHGKCILHEQHSSAGVTVLEVIVHKESLFIISVYIAPDKL